MLKKLERRCDGDGMKAWELLETWYGVQANQTHKVLKLKNEMLQLKADSFGDFIDYMDQLMAVQSKLEKMGKGVDGDIIIMLVTNQIPEEYNQIITILSQKIGEGEGIDVQEWMDVVEAHVNVVDSKHGPREKREVTIANRANPNVSQNIKDNCFYCGEVGHIKRNCVKWIAKKRSYAEKCEYCDENGHLVKDCPLIVPMDKKLTCSFCNEKEHSVKNCPKINHKASIRASKVTIEDHGNTGSSEHWDYEEEEVEEEVDSDNSSESEL